MKTMYHLIGIKGAGMSALATLLHDLGHQVQGSDITQTLFTQKGLDERGIPCYPFLEAPITKEMTVVIGNAYQTHEEVRQAKEAGATCLSYHACLGRLIQSFTSIAVAGTHGKTTTTGLLNSVLGKEFSTAFLIGDGSGSAQPENTHMVFEACEYQRHFLAYYPDYTIITNIEHDHPDYFKDIEDVLNAFYQFALQTKKQIIACGDDDNVLKLNQRTRCFLYGLMPRNDLVGKIIRQYESGTDFEVYIHDRYFGTFHTPFYGKHMVLNSLAVIAVAYLEGLTAEQIEAGLQAFQGVTRRFNEHQKGAQVLIDDYAHHPTEIKATLQAVRQKYPRREMVAIFQPHTFSRTQAFLDEFAQSLEFADAIYLTDIFGSARESQGETSIQDLMNRCSNVQHLTLDNIRKLQNHHEAVLVFMGAGDIQTYETAYLAE